VPGAAHLPARFAATPGTRRPGRPLGDGVAQIKTAEGRDKYENLLRGTMDRKVADFVAVIDPCFYEIAHHRQLDSHLHCPSDR